MTTTTAQRAITDTQRNHYDIECQARQDFGIPTDNDQDLLVVTFVQVQGRYFVDVYRGDAEESYLVYDRQGGGFTFTKIEE